MLTTLGMLMVRPFPDGYDSNAAHGEYVTGRIKSPLYVNTVSSAVIYEKNYGAGSPRARTRGGAYSARAGFDWRFFWRARRQGVGIVKFLIGAGFFRVL